MGPAAALQREARAYVAIDVVVEGDFATAADIAAAGTIQPDFFTVANNVVGHRNVLRFLFNINRTFKGQIAIR